MISSCFPEPTFNSEVVWTNTIESKFVASFPVAAMLEISKNELEPNVDNPVTAGLSYL